MPVSLLTSISATIGRPVDLSCAASSDRKRVEIDDAGRSVTATFRHVGPSRTGRLHAPPDARPPNSRAGRLRAACRPIRNSGVSTILAASVAPLVKITCAGSAPASAATWRRAPSTAARTDAAFAMYGVRIAEQIQCARRTASRACWMQRRSRVPIEIKAWRRHDLSSCAKVLARRLGSFSLKIPAGLAL